MLKDNSDLAFNNAKFNIENIKLIEPGIDKIKSHIEGLNLDKPIQEQLNKFAKELSEIKEELKTLKKKNWIRQFVGWGIQLSSFVTNHAPEKLEEIKEIIKEFFDQFNPPPLIS